MKVPFIFQVLFNTCMLTASNEVRANLTFKMACRTISSARNTERLKVPVSFQTLLDGSEKRQYPEKFHNLYLGKTVMKIRGESCSECCCSPVFYFLYTLLVIMLLVHTPGGIL